MTAARRFHLLLILSLLVCSCVKRAAYHSSPEAPIGKQASSHEDQLLLASDDVFSPLPFLNKDMKPSDLKPLNPKASLRNGQLQVTVDEDPNRDFVEGVFCEGFSSEEASCGEAPQILFFQKNSLAPSRKKSWTLPPAPLREGGRLRAPL